MNGVDWPKMSESLKHALALANERVPSFPCAANKRPATPHGFKEATTDPIELQELWRRFPGPLIGVPTGDFSGLDVLDIDPRHGGDSWLADKVGSRSHACTEPAAADSTCSFNTRSIYDAAPASLDLASMCAPMAATSFGGPPADFL
jgi:Bifunctional DNA primase/polymerase, N-terminal